MRVLLTGATGFIGTRLVRQLTEAGHACVALTRSAARARAALPDLVDAHDWQLLAGPPPPEACAGVDAVINLAGETVVGRWTARKKRAIRETRVLGTQHLLQGLRAAGAKPRVCVTTSAIGYYGDRGDEVLTESSGPGSDFLADVCRAWEEAAQPITELGTRLVTVRVGLVLHPAGGALEAMLTPFKLGLGGPLGSGRQWWPWVHLEDVLGLFARALSDESLSGVYNGVAPNPTIQRDFARVLGRVLGRPSFMPGPRFALRVALGEFADELLNSRRVVPEAALAAGFTHRHPDLEPALRQLLA